MGNHEPVTKPLWRPADLRKAVTEWAAQGFSVIIEPDGKVHVKPATPGGDLDDFDQVDFKR
jgi:hypothetical protein